MAIADRDVLQWKETPGVFLSLAGVAAALTLLFLGMRSVMSIGGVCAEGGPYVPRQPCPDGIPLLMNLGIWGGIISFALYVWFSIRVRGPSFIAFAWPALFLSLGWNFFEFGINPPGDVGLVWGWLICGVIFVIMGGVPLVVVLVAGSAWRSWKGTNPDYERALTSPLSAVRAAVRERTPSDLVDALERLDRLHREGVLTDQEFEAAKRRLLRR